LIGIFAAASPAGTIQHVQVSEQEFHLTVSRSILRPGRVQIQLVDFGADDHDLIIQKKGSAKKIRLGLLHSGEQETQVIAVTKGYYRIWCGVADHAKLGMVGHLLVR
jgi:uncharacterized cupredoxin-like copper-binding protein